MSEERNAVLDAAAKAAAAGPPQPRIVAQIVVTLLENDDIVADARGVSGTGLYGMLERAKMAFAHQEAEQRTKAPRSDLVLARREPPVPRT